MYSRKESLQKLVADLPEDCTWEQFEYSVYLLKKIERGLKDIDEGRVHTTEQIREQLQQWRTSSGQIKP